MSDVWKSPLRLVRAAIQKSPWSLVGPDAASKTPADLCCIAPTCGADLTVTNFGGGNTSANSTPRRAHRLAVRVLWVKGSAAIWVDETRMVLPPVPRKNPASRSTLRGVDHEDAMVAYLPHCTFQPQQAALRRSNTPLHGLLPISHIDHVHPDCPSLRWPRPAPVKAHRAEVWRGGWAGCTGSGPDSIWDYGCGIKCPLSIRGCAGVVLAGHSSFAGANLACLL